MRIISKEHDYYDGVPGSVDPGFVYVRNSHQIIDKEIIKKFKFPYQTTFVTKQGFNEHYRFAYIFFCGKIFCAMQKDNLWFYGENIKPNFIGNKYDYFGRADSFFAWHGKDCHEINLKHQSPIVVYLDGDIWVDFKVVKSGIIADCPLKTYGFAKAVDPYTARQEVEQYLRNTPIVICESNTLSDKTKIQAHGFDPKWSFRDCFPPKRKRKEL